MANINQLLINLGNQSAKLSKDKSVASKKITFSSLITKQTKSKARQNNETKNRDLADFMKKIANDSRLSSNQKKTATSFIKSNRKVFAQEVQRLIKSGKGKSEIYESVMSMLIPALNIAEPENSKPKAPAENSKDNQSQKSITKQHHFKPDKSFEESETVSTKKSEMETIKPNLSANSESLQSIKATKSKESAEIIFQKKSPDAKENNLGESKKIESAPKNDFTETKQDSTKLDLNIEQNITKPSSTGSATKNSKSEKNLEPSESNRKRENLQENENSAQVKTKKTENQQNAEAIQSKAKSKSTTTENMQNNDFLTKIIKEKVMKVNSSDVENSSKATLPEQNQQINDNVQKNEIYHAENRQNKFNNTNQNKNDENKSEDKSKENFQKPNNNKPKISNSKNPKLSATDSENQILTQSFHKRMEMQNQPKILSARNLQDNIEEIKHLMSKMKSGANENFKWAKLKMEIADLGKVDLTFEKRTDSFKIIINGDLNQNNQIIREQFSELRNNLQSQGFGDINLEFNFNKENSEQYQHFSRFTKNRKGNNFSNEDIETETILSPKRSNIISHNKVDYIA